MSKRKYDEAIEELEKLLVSEEEKFKALAEELDLDNEGYLRWEGNLAGIREAVHRLEVACIHSRVTAEQLQALEEANEKLATVMASRIERSERLGIPPVTTLELAQAYAEEHGLVLCRLITPCKEEKQLKDNLEY